MATATTPEPTPDVRRPEEILAQARAGRLVAHQHKERPDHQWHGCGKRHSVA